MSHLCGMNAAHPTDARPILVFATHNPNKVRELQEMLGDQYQIQSLTDIGCHEEIVEDAPTLEGKRPNQSAPRGRALRIGLLCGRHRA